MIEAPPPRAPARPAAAEEQTLSVFQLANLLIRSRYLLIALPLLCGAAAVAYSLSQPRQYRASASFVPNGAEASGSQLSSIAAQLGFSVNSGQPGQSPQFYGDLILTRDILRDAVLTQYTVPVQGRPRRGNLIAFWELGGPEAGGAAGHTPLDEAIKALHGAVGTDVGLETGIVGVNVTSENPRLSEAILRRLITLTQEFDLVKRRTQASARRRFAEERMGEARRDLNRAEAGLDDFVSHNRQFQASPRLLLEQSRLAQDVVLRQQVYGALMQTYEQARIDEVRNTPVITVLESPEGSATPQSRGTVTRALVAAVLGGILALFIAMLRETARAARQARDAEFEEFMTLRWAVFRDVRRLVPFGRRREHNGRAAGA